MIMKNMKCRHLRADYCSALPGDESAERCWRAVRYFEERVAEAQAGCVLPEGGRSAEAGACAAAERLEDFVRQFVGQAPTHMFVQTLLVLESADRHAKERQNTPRELPPRSPHSIVYRIYPVRKRCHVFPSCSPSGSTQQKGSLARAWHRALRGEMEAF
jgi:hypothetical protein